MVLFVLVFTFSLSTVGASSAENGKMSVNDYKEYLREKSKNDDLAKKVFEKLNALSIEEQQRFIDIVYDKEAQLKAFETLSTLENGQVKSLYNGEITISKTFQKTFNYANKQTTAALQESNGLYQETLSILGLPVTIFKIQVWFRYDPSNHVVSETLRANESHWNINPSTLVDDQGNEHWVSGTLACAVGKFKVSLTLSGGAISTTHRLYIQCDDIDVGGWIENG